jgi:putative endopeptidase
MSPPARPLDPLTLDDSIGAADDFYLHVNAGWMEANPIPPEYPAWGALVEADVRNAELLHGILERAAAEPGPTGSTTQHAGDYFTAGMDVKAIEAAGSEPLRPYLDQIDALTSLGELPDLLRDLQLVNVGALHQIAVIPDFQDPDRYHFQLGEGGLGLPEKGYYSRDDEQSVQLRAAYLDHIGRQLANLDLAPDRARAEAERILEFETKLAHASYEPEQARELSLTINRKSLSELDDLMPQFGLSAYVRSFGIEPIELNVDNPGFFRELDAELARTSLQTIRSYLRWHLLRAYASSLSAAFEDEAFDFYGRQLSGQQQPKERWKRVLAAATADIGEQVAQLYVAEAFGDEAKSRCEHMVEALIEAMGRAIRELDWMTEATRVAALEKLESFNYKIGYPDTWRDYSGLGIDRNSFAANRMRSATFEAQRQIGRLDEPVDKEEWEMPAHLVNAYYHPLLNEIVFPAGILQPPLFYVDADDAVNFGGIGTVIGHEITHGFDDQGRRFDATGAVRDWWTEEDTAEFTRLADRLAAQFDEYRVLDDQPINGRLTLGENIADLGGVAIAYDAWSRTQGSDQPAIDGLSAVQRFFVAYATIWRMNYSDALLAMRIKVDPHSPGQFRVNGPISNFPPFAEAFGIEGASAMARSAEGRVKIW